MDTVLYRPRLELGDPGIHLDPGSLPWRNGLLIRATNWLGDALMTLPATHRLSRWVPEPCRTFVLCPASMQRLWEAVPWVSVVVPFRGRRCDRVVSRTVRRLGAGVAVVLPNSFGSAWDVFGLGIPVRLGRRGRGRSWLLTHRAAAWHRGVGTGQRHQLSWYLELASVFGPVAPEWDSPPLLVPGAEETAGALGIRRAAGPWLVLAPGAAYGPAKQWPVERFAAVGDWWQGRGGRVAVVGAGSEREAGGAIARALPGVVNLAGATDLGQLMAVLTTAAAVVANDSGAMHLGAALGCRGVAVFGSTDAVATGPIGGKWVILRDPPDCAPCLRRTCRRRDIPYECLLRIEPHTVCQALDSLLSPDAESTDGEPPGAEHLARR